MEDQFQMILAHKFLNAFKPEDVAEFAVSTVILITIIIANLIIKNWKKILLQRNANEQQ